MSKKTKTKKAKPQTLSERVEVEAAADAGVDSHRGMRGTGLPYPDRGLRALSADELTAHLRDQAADAAEAAG